jgi:RNA polymerase sigma factor (sigma-70 family)
MPDPQPVSHWIDLVKQGRDSAAKHLWEFYYDRLVTSVRRRLFGSNRGVSDEDDIIVSVFDSFCVAVKQGRFPDLTDRDDLWRLLLTMAARKVIDKRRHDQRQRRGGATRTLSLDDPDLAPDIQAAIGREPSPEMVVMMEESVKEFLSHLGGGSLQELAGAKLEGYSNAELAVRFACSERTIERRLHLIREKLQQELVNNHDTESHSITDQGSGAD